MNNITLIFGSTPSGNELKRKICTYFSSPVMKVSSIYDSQCFNTDIVDYPTNEVCHIINKFNVPNCFGILVGETGFGLNIIANKHKNIRCVVCNDIFSAEVARNQFNANCLTMGTNIVSFESAIKIIHKFIETKYLE